VVGFDGWVLKGFIGGFFTDCFGFSDTTRLCVETFPRPHRVLLDLFSFILFLLIVIFSSFSASIFFNRSFFLISKIFSVGSYYISHSATTLVDA
jgi:hypothetical protein